MCPVILPAVPLGKRLVVRHVSVSGSLSQSGTFLTVSVFGPTRSVSAFASPLYGPSGHQVFAFDQPVLGVVDAAELLNVFVITDGFMTSGSVIVTGYLLDCTVNQCASIAP